MKRFAVKVDALLSASGLSQADLARACGVSQPSVNDWLRKPERMPRSDQLLTIARTLGVSVDYLVDDEIVEPPFRAHGARCREVIDVIRTIGVAEAWRRLVMQPEFNPGRPYADADADAPPATPGANPNHRRV